MTGRAKTPDNALEYQIGIKANDKERQFAMNPPGRMDYIGTIANFTNCTHIGDGVDYFEFALTEPIVDPNVPPIEDVFYITPGDSTLMQNIAVVAWAWKTRQRVHVHLQGNPHQMLVETVQFET